MRGRRPRIKDQRAEEYIMKLREAGFVLSVPFFYFIYLYIFFFFFPILKDDNNKEGKD